MTPILLTLFQFTLCFHVVYANIVTYNFNLTWVSASPDGFTRPVIGINNVWPNPTIIATLGDTIVVNVHNQLGNQSSSLHFHGLFMNGTNHMDGTSGIVQCAIPPDGTFKYEFEAQQVGTYWYHSHMQSQYPDGLRGAMIIHDPKSPYSSQYDDEILLTLSDWYHGQIPELLPIYEDPAKSMLPDPIPDGFLMNDTRDPKIRIDPRKTYLVRLINIGALRSQKFWIEGHSMTIVELDGSYTKLTDTEVVTLAPGQRCAFLVKMKETSDRNYVMAAAVDRSSDRMMKSSMPSKPIPIAVSGWLVYNESAPYDFLTASTATDAIDDVSIQPYDGEELLPFPDITLNLVVDMKRLEDGKEHWMFNTTAYTRPKIPTLFSAITNEKYDGSDSPFMLPLNSTVEIILYNKHMTGHPFHIHGHTFQIAHRSGKSAGRYNSSVPLTLSPIRRDTVMVPGGGNAVLRFRTDNPGVWFFHCHMEWHAHSGLAMIFIEGQETIYSQARLSLGEKLSLTNLRECVPQELLSSVTADEDNHRDKQDSHQGATWSAFATAVMLLGFVLASGVAILVFGRLQNGSWSVMQRSKGHEYQVIELEDDDGDNDDEHEKRFGSGELVTNADGHASIGDRLDAVLSQ